ncbi:MAG TPA: M20/M25/M40 family metallo-hydrolase [Thermoanaerobaculia bacterium]|jgi:putative aminopeptidase FrvX|nr:M20/M25/M40 family metallo-hydrolase [Thermoanaerobaculia bacterium]
MKFRTPVALFLLSITSADLRAATLDEEAGAFLNIVAVSGREQPAADFIAGRLAGLPATRDALGDVVLTVGSGEPRRLVACALGEPGLIVSSIREDGYLRVVPDGSRLLGALWTQSFEGQTVVIGGAQGWRAGAVVLPSIHLQQGAKGLREQPFSAEDLYIDVGAESAAEVAAMGIRLIDPVALIRRPSKMAGGLVAAPAAAQKGACAALADVARRYSAGAGTVVFTWTVSDGLNRAGLQHIARQRGPFQEVLLMGPGFGWEAVEGKPPAPKPLPVPGSGPISAGKLPAALTGTVAAPHLEPGGPKWGAARVGYLGLPARYPGTPVETIAFRDVQALSEAVLEALGGRGRSAVAAPPLPAPPAIVETGTGHQEAARLLATLIARYGVSGAEAPVREEVLLSLPAWVKPETDAKGNVTVTIGGGGDPILFVAHMDEVGFRVEEVLPDGRLRLQKRGGLISSVWEAQAALVHGDRGPVAAVFEPRADWWTAGKAPLPDPPTVYLGASSAREAEALGIHAGSTVTMPKRMFRIGAHRAVARGFDDRAGSTALLLALRRLDPAKLRRRVIFAWSVEEEVGLNGAQALAERLGSLAEVHAIDTFVSSDSPIESARFAGARLGHGPVLRAMDNGYLAPRETIDHFLSVARQAGVPIQVGFTGGATDAMPFLPDGAALLPFSWPGRYSHSPVEVADLRDIESLVKLIVAVATAPPGGSDPLRP